jgi:hypothetical protein
MKPILFTLAICLAPVSLLQADSTHIDGAATLETGQVRAINNEAGMAHQRSAAANAGMNAQQSNAREVAFTLTFKGKGNADADTATYQQRQITAQQAYALQMQQLRQLQLMQQMLANYYYYPSPNPSYLPPMTGY